MLQAQTKKLLRKKLPFLLLFVLLLPCGILLSCGQKSSPQTPFQALCREILCTELSESTLNRHYLLAHPEVYDIASQVALPPYESGSARGENRTLKHYLEELSQISAETLSGSDAYLYSLLERELQLENRLDAYAYYSNPLSPHSGQQALLLTLLSEYTFYTPDDVEDYLELLSLIPAYLDGLTLYMEEKIDAGLSPGSACLTESADACLSYFSPKELMSRTHFLQTTFLSRLDAVTDADGKQKAFSAAEIKKLSERNDELLKDAVYPAYRKLARELNRLAASGGETKGLASYPGGREYYETLLQLETGCDDTIEQIHERLTKELSRSMNEILLLRSKTPVVTDATMELRVREAFPLTEPQEMLQQLENRMSRDFPMPSESLCQKLQVRICEISPSMRKNSAPAFYLLPPMDSYYENVIYLNPDDKATAYQLYTTLAHEGYPGHLYQTVTHYDRMRELSVSPVWGLLSYPGFQEGYALYVEFLSYDYCSELYSDRELPEMADYILYQKENRNLQLCLSALLELMIHGEGASLHTVTDLLWNFGITNPEQIEKLYQYIAWEPCCYLKYYLGYLEIEELRTMAMENWGDAYSLPAFHRFLMEYGPGDFATLKKYLTKG